MEAATCKQFGRVVVTGLYLEEAWLLCLARKLTVWPDMSVMQENAVDYFYSCQFGRFH